MPEFFFFVDFEQVFSEIFFGRKSLFHFLVAVVYYTSLQEYLHSNAAAKKLGGGVVALKIPRKLTCGSSFCNALGSKTQILMEIGYTREIYLKNFRGAILQKSVFSCKSY